MDDELSESLWKGLPGDLKLKAAVTRVAFRIPRGGRREENKITVLPFTIEDLGLPEDLLENSPMQRKLDDIQGSPPPSSRTFHSKEQGVRQKGQEASRDEKGDPGKTQTQKVYKRNTYKKKQEQKPSQREASWAEGLLGRLAGDGEATLLASASQPNSGSAPRVPFRRAGSRSRLAAGRALTPHVANPSQPPGSGHQPRALPDARAQPAVLARTRRPTAPTEREHIPAEESGVLSGASERTGERSGVRAGWGNLRRQGDVPLCAGKRHARLRPSISSTPDLMGIKNQEIKPPARPSGLGCPSPSRAAGRETLTELFLALPRPSPLKAAQARREGSYLPRVAAGPPGRALSARCSAQNLLGKKYSTGQTLK
ncbi:nucleolar and coiled-body phosphoprotein 1-like [Myiozetetes cayanensis]|uniref:nucleolar and coiled-body phosphoprotein 1-like n=1 Tax=Myiozetetes cayanensis TaxID=478635 RepID=UPI00215E981E|nr:nucleolar and coiled-body phosphoprotein 1-like [Myiozetetes cayanensis]